MIIRPTVLVLGAGASKPYQFPTGAELTEEILTGLTDGAGWAEPLRESPALIEEFRVAFRDSGQLSIDNFLTRRRKFYEVGRRAIARVILPRERRSLLTVRARSWYHLLFRYLETPHLNEFGDNQISFVTFNYDRSLEQFLTMSVSNTYEVSMAEAWSHVKRLNIVHVHGQLGPFDPDNGLPFDARHDAESVVRAANDIRLVRDNMEPCKEATQLLAEAEIVAFLGFGFDPANIKILQPHLIRANTKSIAVATYKSMTDAQRIEARTSIPGLPWTRSDLEDEKCDCYSMLCETNILARASTHA